MMKRDLSYEENYDGFVKLFVNKFVELGIQKNQILMLHVSLKDIANHTKFTYKECAKLILESLNYFSPKSILVPSFTYSFVKSGVFSNLFSKSETGRFSEEVRLNFSKYRSQDPIFSVLDTTNWLSKKEIEIDTNQSFGSDTLWSILDKEDCLIINIGLEHLIATHIHHIEKINNVPYRKNVVKRGIKYTDAFNYQNVEYNFFARSLDEKYLLDWQYIEKILNKKDVLFKSQLMGANFSVLSTRSLHNAITPLLSANKFLLVKK
jgi:aminoglycoside N3'-acetyltransferase